MTVLTKHTLNEHVGVFELIGSKQGHPAIVGAVVKLIDPSRWHNPYQPEYDIQSDDNKQIYRVVEQDIDRTGKLLKAKK